MKYNLPVPYSPLTFEEKRAVREQYVTQQRALCRYCGAPIFLPPPHYLFLTPVDGRLFPKGFFAHPVHLHHDHGTDLTIGAVHSYCNAILWQYHGQ